MKNTPWRRDELILALEVYFRIWPKTPGPKTHEIRELSEILNRFPVAVGESRPANHRSVASVVMKLMNFRRLDPSYPGRGLRGGGEADSAVWREYSDAKEQLATVAKTIKEVISSGAQPIVPLSGVVEAPEGALLTRMHLERERDRRLVERRKQLALERIGCLICEVCGFDFEAVYGERGRGFIECHHLKPLHMLTPGSRTHVDDLALLCANCHRMVHASRPWLSVLETKALLRPYSVAPP